MMSPHGPKRTCRLARIMSVPGCTAVPALQADVQKRTSADQSSDIHARDALRCSVSAAIPSSIVLGREIILQLEQMPPSSITIAAA
jgi:hypothetical protein